MDRQRARSKKVEGRGPRAGAFGKDGSEMRKHKVRRALRRWAGSLSCRRDGVQHPAVDRAGAVAAGTTTTIILVRHAERPEGLDPR